MNPSTYKLIRVTASMTRVLHSQLKQEARDAGISLNTLLLRKLRQELAPAKAESAT